MTKLVGLLLALAWLGTVATRPDAKRDFLRVYPRISGALLIFLAWNGLSYAWSEHPAAALDALSRSRSERDPLPDRLHGHPERADVLRVFWAFIAACSLARRIVVAHRRRVRPLRGGGKDREQPGQLQQLAARPAWQAPRWPSGRALVARPHAGAPHRGIRGRALMLAGIILTVSRSGLIALFVAVIAAIIFAGRWRPRVIALSLVVVGSAVVYFAFFAPAVDRERVTSSEEGGHGREDIWRVGWRMVEAHPVQRGGRRKLLHLIHPLPPCPTRAAPQIRLHRRHPEGRPQRLPPGLGGDRRDRPGPLPGRDPGVAVLQSESDQAVRA